jgi:hypothetical protein
MPGPNKEMARVARNLIRENEDVRLTVKELDRCVSDGPGLGKTCNLSEARSCPMGPVHTPLPPPASESLSLGDCRESCVFIGLLVLVGVCYW